MAQRVKIILEDDLDGSTADETVTFGLDGVTYEIDLSAANAAKLRDDFASWVGHARRSGGRKSTGGPRLLDVCQACRPCGSARVGAQERLRGQRPRADLR